MLIAARDGRIHVIQQLLAGDTVDDINQGNGAGETPLWTAALLGHLPCVDALLADGRAEVNLADHDGWTPLYVAACEGHLACLETILADGRADINARNIDGWTSLLGACSRGQPEAVDMLITAGADPWLRPHTGHHFNRTPLDVAVAKGDNGCVFVLENFLYRRPWTLGPAGSLQHMPRWVKDRAVTAVLCLQYHGLPPEIIDHILPFCTVAQRP